MINFKDKVNNILDKQKSVSLRFLSLEEQTYLQNKKDVILNGGYGDAEKKRAYFFDNDDDNIICYKIIYNEKYLNLSHQNILGTLLSLGVTLDSIGDILPRQSVFFITKEIQQEIMYSFTKINNTSIELSIYNKELVKSEKAFIEYKTTLDSTRLDLVISKITKMSRNNAAELILKEMIKVNHKVITKGTTVIKEDDVLSIRKFGRFQVIDTKNKSKKGKIIFKYIKYI